MLYAEALPHDVVYQVCSEFGMKGVLLSDLGIPEAYAKAADIFGSLDGLESWALFLPYSSSSAGDMRSELSADDLSTFAHSAVENTVCCEFGVLLLEDGGSVEGQRLFDRLSERAGKNDGCAVRQGRFIVYAASGELAVNEALRLLYCTD